MDNFGYEPKSCILDFSDTLELSATMKLLLFLKKAEICKLNKVSKIEHWFSDMIVVEWEQR